MFLEGVVGGSGTVGEEGVNGGSKSHNHSKPNQQASQIPWCPASRPKWPLRHIFSSPRPSADAALAWPNGKRWQLWGGGLILIKMCLSQPRCWAGKYIKAQTLTRQETGQTGKHFHVWGVWINCRTVICITTRIYMYLYHDNYDILSKNCGYQHMVCLSSHYWWLLEENVII